MNQPVPTAAPRVNPAAAAVPQAPVLPPNPRNWKKIILVSLIPVLAIVLLAGVYFLGAGIQSKKDAAALKASEAAAVPAETPPPSPSPVPKIAAGLTKTQKLIDEGGKTIIRSVVQVSYSGVLKAVDPDKSWTVEREGKSVTIGQEGSQQVQYTLFKDQTSAPQKASASDLGVGDTVTITSFVDSTTGVASVAAISFFKKV